MPYMGNTTRKASDIRRYDVTSSTSATHTLTWTAPNEQSLIVTINGVKQHEDAYSVSGTTLTLTSALVATDKLEVIGINDVGTTITPAQGSVNTDQLATNSVTLAKLSDGTQGGIIYYGASGAPTELAASTSGYFLKTQGAAANPAWAEVPPGAPTGGGTEKVFFNNENSVDVDYTIPANTNSVSCGPITIASGVTVNIGATSNWVIV